MNLSWETGCNEANREVRRLVLFLWFPHFLLKKDSRDIFDVLDKGMF